MEILCGAPGCDENKSMPGSQRYIIFYENLLNNPIYCILSVLTYIEKVRHNSTASIHKHSMVHWTKKVPW